MDINSAIELPPIWLPIISGLLIPWLNAAATQSVDDSAPEHVQRWERRLRKMFAGLASVLVVVIDMAATGEPFSLASALPAAVLAYMAQRGTWTATKEFAVNPNKVLVPLRGLDPHTVAAKAQVYADRIKAAA